jgi:hypothetical protein
MGNIAGLLPPAFRFIIEIHFKQFFRFDIATDVTPSD